MEELFKALGDPNRLRIVNLLMHKELCVCEIEEILQTTQSNASRHLTKLRQAGIISCKKKAQWAYYQVHPEFVASHALLYQYLKEKQAKEGVYREDLKTLQGFNKQQKTCETPA